MNNYFLTLNKFNKYKSKIGSNLIFTVTYFKVLEMNKLKLEIIAMI